MLSKGKFRFQITYHQRVKATFLISTERLLNANLKRPGIQSEQTKNTGKDEPLSVPQLQQFSSSNKPTRGSDTKYHIKGPMSCFSGYYPVPLCVMKVFMHVNGLQSQKPSKYTL